MIDELCAMESTMSHFACPSSKIEALPFLSIAFLALCLCLVVSVLSASSFVWFLRNTGQEEIDES